MNRVVFTAAALLVAATVVACGGEEAGAPGGEHDMTGMSGTSGMSGMSPSPAAEAPFDALFIDSMVMHHEGAVAMAQQALEGASRPEIKNLATDIIRTQEQEVSEMRQWRDEWYADLPDTSGLEMAMGTMEIESDPQKPFDLRFIEAMISHHEGAIQMATEARDTAVHAELKTLAANIIAAQESEIAQMEQWKREWFPQ